MTTKPLPIRLLNRAGGALRGVGISIPNLDPDKLKRAACKETGLTDFGDDDYLEGLHHLCRTIDQEDRLSSLGRLVYSDNIRRSLCNRLLHVERLRTSPPKPLQRAPLVLLGMPRTGSTFLHRMVALLESTRAPVAWELQRPHPPLKGEDQRQNTTATGMTRMHSLAPHLDSIHYVRADEADECRMLHDPSFCSLTFAVMGPVYGYLEWFLQQELTVPYQAWSEMLRYLAEPTPTLHLALKAPVHSGNIGALMQAMPTARLVQTHRDPAKVVASVCSLLETFHNITSDDVDKHELGRRWLDMLVRYTARNMEQRRGLDVHDVYFPDLVGDPVGTVRGICEHHDVPFSASDATRITEWVAARPVHKHGVHKYTLESYGLSVEHVHAAFASYLQQHPRALGAPALA